MCCVYKEVEEDEKTADVFRRQLKCQYVVLTKTQTFEHQQTPRVAADADEVADGQNAVA